MTARLDGVTVLLVDDDKDLRDVFSLRLQDAGALSIPVATAEEALAVLDTVTCHVILTDVGLPDHDGLWFVEQLGRRPETARIPVIALSGYPRPASAVGFTRWLLKPVDSATVVQAIWAALGRGPEEGSGTL